MVFTCEFLWDKGQCFLANSHGEKVAYLGGLLPHKGGWCWQRVDDPRMEISTTELPEHEARAEVEKRIRRMAVEP